MSKEIPRCPHCEKKLKFEDHVKRHKKLAGGKKEWFSIERCSCPSGCGWHRLLPDFLAPHKHYDVKIITECLNGTNSLATEDYPCDKTKERWQRWILLNLLFINVYLKETGIRLFAIGIVLTYACANIVEELKHDEKHGWLKIVIRSVYNTGARLKPFRDRPG